MTSKSIYSDAATIRVRDTESFIRKASFIHKNVYGYGSVKYVKSIEKVAITCHTHGDFEQTPNSHLNGNGCPKCAAEATSKRLSSSQEEFTKKAISVHGDKYSYDLVEYINSTTKVVIVCPSHGSFIIRPNNFLSGQGCMKCANQATGERSVLSSQEFIERAKKIHNGRYTYEKTVFKHTKAPVTVTCPTHGEFSTGAGNHMRGHGCPSCALYRNAVKSRSTTEEFIQKSRDIHNGLYDYTKTKYHTCKEKVVITCTIHGDFKMTPSDHLSGRGCMKCANNIRSRAAMNRFDGVLATLYHIRIFNEDVSFEKVGITTKAVRSRFSRIHLDGFQYEIIDSIEGTPDRLLDLEDEIMKHLDDANERYRIRHLKGSRTRGWSECFNEGLIDLNDFID